MTAQSYSFKPALLRGERTYRLVGRALTLHDGTEVDLAAVTAAGFVNHTLRRSRIMRLDLYLGEEKHSIGYNGAEGAWQTDPHARAFLMLVRDVLASVSGLQPDFVVRLGETGGIRMAMFVIGVLSALGGGGLFVTALASGVSADRLSAAALPTLLMLGLGAVLVRAYWPWRAAPTGTAGAVATVVDEVIGKLGAA